jgi:hypothetical protein
MQLRCAYDPLVGGPFKSFAALIGAAKAQNDTRAGTTPQSNNKFAPKTSKFGSKFNNNGYKKSGLGVNKQPFKSGADKTCHICGKFGHLMRNCPDANGQVPGPPRSNGNGGGKNKSFYRRSNQPSGHMKYAPLEHFPTLVCANLLSRDGRVMRILRGEECSEVSNYEGQATFSCPVRSQIAEAL